jgi:DNA-binding MarR family transcriptional regulator
MQRPDNKKSVYIFLTPKGRQLKAKLVPLAEQVNDIAVHGIPKKDVQATRQTLLAIIENLAADEGANESRRLPSTRELARLVANAD